ncbi:MAG: retroviral-like aspartic protease family protein [Candidatus Omnitrophica bacterium]|nr:retroviral-like aspartic protease family protein [Candidatus Omnitrophota bacterium]MBU4590528.1 retroviral-like aspartic protease family protein [Candidatus Omnitrophota bacterium]
MKIKIFTFVFFFLFVLISETSSDTIHLKNGRKMEGLIKKETEDAVWLDLGIGSVKFRREEIERVDRSSSEEADVIRQEWQKNEDLEIEAGEKEDYTPKEVGFSRESGHIFVNALLNDNVEATLLLDTGAPMILLSDHMTKKLGIKTHGVKVATTSVLGVSDLRIVYTVLDSVKVEGVEARNVDTEAALDETPELMKDGLLGLAFLRRFNFQIDTVNKKLILEKRKTQDILEQTEYFSVMVPSDWWSWRDEEILKIKGPNLTVKTGPIKPYISIRKYVRKERISYMKRWKDYYDLRRNSPELKHEMSEGLERGFYRSYSQDSYTFISSDFEEMKDFILLHTIFIDNEEHAKRYEIDLITKDEPIKAYLLRFSCVEQYFDKYLPVFEKCLKSFSILPNQ